MLKIFISIFYIIIIYDYFIDIYEFHLIKFDIDFSYYLLSYINQSVYIFAFLYADLALLFLISFSI